MSDPRICTTPMAEFNHLSLQQAARVESWRLMHSDEYILRIYVANPGRPTMADLAAYLLRNPRRSDVAA